MLAIVDLEERVLRDHLLRRIKVVSDGAQAWVADLDAALASSSVARKLSSLKSLLAFGARCTTRRFPTPFAWLDRVASLRGSERLERVSL